MIIIILESSRVVILHCKHAFPLVRESCLGGISRYLVFTCTLPPSLAVWSSGPSPLPPLCHVFIHLPI